MERTTGDDPATSWMEARRSPNVSYVRMECVMGDDPTTSALARRRSTNVSYTHMVRTR